MGTTAPIAGYLGEKFSYRRLYLFSLIGFTATSALCALAWNEHSLILFRVLQGAFSGLIIPATMSIIYQIIPKEKQAMAISFWGLSAMLAPAFGPTISGWILQNFDWQWLFLMNIPIGLLAIAFVLAYIPYYRLNVPKSFDGLGFNTVVLSTGKPQRPNANPHNRIIRIQKAGSRQGWGISSVCRLLLCAIIRRLLRKAEPRFANSRVNKTRRMVHV